MSGVRMLHFSMGVATENYLLLVGGGGGEALSHPPLTIDNPPWLRPCTFQTIDENAFKSLLLGLVINTIDRSLLHVSMTKSLF